MPVKTLQFQGNLKNGNLRVRLCESYLQIRSGHWRFRFESIFATLDNEFSHYISVGCSLVLAPQLRGNSLVVEAAPLHVLLFAKAYRQASETLILSPGSSTVWHHFVSGSPDLEIHFRFVDPTLRNKDLNFYVCGLMYFEEMK